MRHMTAGVVLAVAGYAAITATASAAPETVDITVVLSIGTDPEDARTFHAADVALGDGVELDLDDETKPNETGFEGAVAVDIDPEDGTVTLLPRESGGLYEVVEVSISGSGFVGIVTVADDLFADDDPYVLDVNADADGLSIRYDAGVDQLIELKGESAPSPNTAVFAFDVAPTESPTTVAATVTSAPDAPVPTTPDAVPVTRTPTFTG